MEHWHRCSRWERRRIACPFREEAEHQEHEEDVQARRTQLIPTPWGVPPPAGLPALKPEVGVREKGGRVRALEGSVSVPEPVAVPPSAGSPVPVPPRVLPQPVGPAEVITRLLKEIPEKWIPNAEDLAFLQKEASIGKARVAKGVPLKESIRRMIAEEGAARAFSGAEDTFEFPWWIFALPLIREAFTKLKLSPFGPKMVPADFVRSAGPGGKGDPARLNPADRKLADAIQRARGRPPTAGAKPAGRAGGVAGGGKQIDARNLMQNVTNVGRRTVQPFRQSDPAL